MFSFAGISKHQDEDGLSPCDDKIWDLFRRNPMEGSGLTKWYQEEYIEEKFKVGIYSHVGTILDPGLSDNASLTESSTVVEEPPAPVEEEEDIWKRAFSDPENEKAKNLSWESLGRNKNSSHGRIPNGELIPSPYLTEANTEVYESVFYKYFRHCFRSETELLSISYETLFDSIVKMMLGTSSDIFDYDNERSKFVITLSKVRIKSCSSKSLSRVLERFLCCGTYFRRLERVAKDCINNPRLFGLTGVAFGQALLSYIIFCQTTISQLVQTSGQQKSMTILELYHLMEGVSFILEKLAELSYCEEPSSRAKQLKAQQSSQYEAMGFFVPRGVYLLGTLYEEASFLDFNTSESCSLLGLYRSVLLVLLDRASSPYLNMLNFWLGLEDVSNTGGFCVNSSADSILSHLDPYEEFFITNTDGETSFLQRDGDGFWEDGFQLNSSSPPPQFIGKSLARDILEAGKSLWLLRQCRPDHPLAKVSNFAEYSKLVGVKWAMTKGDIENLHSALQDYIAIVISAIRQRNIRIFRRATLDIPLTENDADGIEEYSFENKIGLKPGEPSTNAREEIVEPSEEIKDVSQIQQDVCNKFAFISFAKHTPYLFFSDTAPNDAGSLSSFISRLQEASQNPLSPDLAPDGYIPPLDLLASLSIRHTLSIHYRLINTATLSLFFHDLGLRSYMLPLRWFMLMGDGAFVRKVDEALFYDGIEMEDRADYARVVKQKFAAPGLNATVSYSLEGRNSMARNTFFASLNNALFEPIATRQAVEPHLVKETAVKGLDEIISFGMQKEHERQSNPNSMHALDFLYLKYDPPYPLNVIITPNILGKYNRLFAFLLRLRRMEAVTRHTYRLISFPRRRANSPYPPIPAVFLRFQFEARQFVNAFSGYTMEVAIGATWHSFEKRLDHIAREVLLELSPAEPDSLEDWESEAPPSAPSVSAELDSLIGEDLHREGVRDLESLRTYHELIVDRMLSHCLLKKRYEPVMKIIHGVFSVILEFANEARKHHSHLYEEGEEPGAENSCECFGRVEELYCSFKRYVGILVKILIDWGAKGADTQLSHTPTVRERLGTGAESSDRNYHRRIDIIQSATGKGGFLRLLLMRLDMNGFYTDTWKSQSR
ncbi:uncharacterized protein VTP21DRAFT_8336 [Calcarisporiella thermophila]|uniref:uncharacterized protein n=1 Tax=Calcarisporiella thermophila TaxID=911321 RepID=UPI003742B05F